MKPLSLTRHHRGSINDGSIPAHKWDVHTVGSHTQRHRPDCPESIGNNSIHHPLVGVGLAQARDHRGHPQYSVVPAQEFGLEVDPEPALEEDCQDHAAEAEPEPEPVLVLLLVQEVYLEAGRPELVADSLGPVGAVVAGFLRLDKLG